MASPAKMLKVLGLVAMLMMVITPKGEAQFSCMSVMSSVMTCADYVLKGGDVPRACCTEVASLFKSAATGSDRRGLCSCLRAACSGQINVNFDNVASLPDKCGLNDALPFKLSADVDCSTVM